jgi:hypothetical protein
MVVICCAGSVLAQQSRRKSDEKSFIARQKGYNVAVLRLLSQENTKTTLQKSGYF